MRWRESGSVLGRELGDQLADHVGVEVHADIPAGIERDRHAAADAAQQPGKLGQDAARKVGVMLGKGLGAFGAAEHDEDAFAVFVLDDQRFGLGATLKALDRVFLIAYRHEQLLIDQLQHEGLGVERAGMDGDQLLFKRVVGDEIHECQALARDGEV